MSCNFSSYLSRLTFVTLRVSTIFFSGTRVVGCCVAVDLLGFACCWGCWGCAGFFCWPACCWGCWAGFAAPCAGAAFGSGFFSGAVSA